MNNPRMERLRNLILLRAAEQGVTIFTSCHPAECARRLRLLAAEERRGPGPIAARGETDATFKVMLKAAPDDPGTWYVITQAVRPPFLSAFGRMHTDRLGTQIDLRFGTPTVWALAVLGFVVFGVLAAVAGILPARFDGAYHIGWSLVLVEAAPVVCSIPLILRTSAARRPVDARIVGRHPRRKAARRAYANTSKRAAASTGPETRTGSADVVAALASRGG